MSDVVLAVEPLGFPWVTSDPFLFCVHHQDAYPAGNDRLGPDPALLAGRELGMDFELRDGWRMYHGDVVPGFPRHPHRGFETITIARRGFIDHADSLGAAARFGRGDVQWMTAGRGIVHSEMFPLLNRDAPNPTELFQIWLNLPAEDKLVLPHFRMLWAESLPTHRRDGVEVRIVAGAFGGKAAPPPPSHSWAARPEAEVAILEIRMDADARCVVPAAGRGVARTVYAFAGAGLRVAGQAARVACAVRVRADADLSIESDRAPAELLVLQGRPIGEPVVQHGPFVMTRASEIAQAVEDYQRDGFGGWPFDSDGPVHGAATTRFARHADGALDEPGAPPAA